MFKYKKSVLWRVAKCQFYIEEARCLKVNLLARGVGEGGINKSVGKVKVKFTLVQALRFCTGRTAHRGVEV